MNIDEIIMRASAIKLLANVGDKQAVFDECNRIIAICEASQQSVQSTDGSLCKDCGHPVEIKQVAGCLYHPVSG